MTTTENEPKLKRMSVLSFEDYAKSPDGPFLSLTAIMKLLIEKNILTDEEILNKEKEIYNQLLPIITKSVEEYNKKIFGE